jgi:hypothetical protein
LIQFPKDIIDNISIASSPSTTTTSLSSSPLPSSSSYLFQPSKQAQLIINLQQNVIPELCRAIRELSKEVFANDNSPLLQGQCAAVDNGASSTPSSSPFSSPYPSRPMSPSETSLPSLPYAATLSSSTLFTRPRSRGTAKSRDRGPCADPSGRAMREQQRRCSRRGNRPHWRQTTRSRGPSAPGSSHPSAAAPGRARALNLRPSTMRSLSLTTQNTLSPGHGFQASQTHTA